MIREKKIPLRRCIGCNESFPKSELIRVVRSPEGVISLDFTGKANGRGAYICKRSECFRKARKQGRLRSNLNCDIPDEILLALEEKITKIENANTETE